MPFPNNTVRFASSPVSSKTARKPRLKSNRGHRDGNRGHDGKKNHHNGRYNGRKSDSDDGRRDRNPYPRQDHRRQEDNNGGRSEDNRPRHDRGQGRHGQGSGRDHQNQHHRGRPQREDRDRRNRPERGGRDSRGHHHTQPAEKEQKPKMWASGDEVDTEVEASYESSPAYDSEDEVLDDAPADSAQQDAAPGRRSNIRHLESSLNGILDANKQVPPARDRTLQAFLRQLGGQGTDFDRWVQKGHGLQLKDLTEWEENQRRLLAELEATLYDRYCEAEKAQAQLQREREIQEQQQQQAQQTQQLSQPQPSRPYQPEPPQPTQPPAEPTPMTHADKLSALLTRTTNLKQALFNTKDLITQNDLHSAQREHRATRTAEIASFFSTLTTTVDHAASTIHSFHREAKKREQAGGVFQWIPSAELDFCAAWEGVVEGYQEVWNLERAVGFQMGQGHGADDGWERYLAALGRFAERVRGFGEEQK